YLAASGVEYRRSEDGKRVVFEIVSDPSPPAPLPSPTQPPGEGRKRAEESAFSVLPVEGRKFATGDARGLSDAEALNLAHPLVQAAIADARSWPGGGPDGLVGSMALRLPP